MILGELMKNLALLGYPANGKSIPSKTGPLSAIANSTSVTGTFTTSTYPTQLAAGNIPANRAGKTGQVVISFDLTNNDSANEKNFWIEVGGVQVGPTITNTTGTKITGKLILSMNDATDSVNVYSNVTAGTASTGWATNIALDMTMAHTVVLMSMLTNYPTTDTIVLNSYDIESGTPPVPSGKAGFYGVNHHWTYTLPVQNIIDVMKFMNMTMLRLDVYNISDLNGNNMTSLQNAVMFAQAFQQDNTGLQMYCLVGGSMESSPGVAYPDEATAYAANYQFGYDTAKALQPYGVMYYECGNELDAASAGGVSIRPTIASWGTVAVDFTNSVWPLFRGAVRGMMDGVRAAQPNAIVGANAFTNASFWAAYALWNGLQPDGTSGHPVCRWDFTPWHFYAEGNGTDVPYSGGGGQPQFNLLQLIRDAFGKPIMLSEWHPSQASDALNASVGTQLMNDFYGLRSTYGIASVMIYDLFDEEFAMFSNDAQLTTPNQFGAAMKSFIAAHKG